MIQSGWVVEVTERVSGRRIQHAALVVPHHDHPNGKTVWYYSPDLSKTTVSVVQLSALVKKIDWNGPVIGIYL